MTSEGLGANVQATLQRSAVGVREFFSMRGAMTKSAALSAQARAATRPLYDAALERLSGADQLWAAGNSATALELYRGAAVLFMRAFLTAEMREGDAQSSDPQALFASVTPAFDARADRITRDALSRLQSLIVLEPTELERVGEQENRREVSEFARDSDGVAESASARRFIRAWRGGCDVESSERRYNAAYHRRIDGGALL